MKFLAKLSVVVLVVGGILFAAGHAMGGSVYSAWYGGALHPFREAFSIGWSSWQNERGDIVDDAKDAAREALDDARDALDDARDAVGHHPESEHTGSMQNGETAFTDSHTQNLSFSLGRGDYAIVRGTDDSFSISGTGLDAIQNWVEGDTWCIAYDDAHGARNQERAVTITLPRDFQPEQVELNIGAASAALCALGADEIEVNVGAGSLTADALDAEELELTVGAGSADVKLGGGWSDYRYDVTSGMGSVTANGITLTEGIAGEVAAGSGARHLNLACGMGSINLTTQASPNSNAERSVFP